MTVFWTEEMEKLFNLYDPWMNGTELLDDAPQEVKAAEKRFRELYEEQKERQMKLEGYI